MLSYLQAEQPAGRTAASWTAAIRSAHAAAGLPDPCGGTAAAWVRARRRPARPAAGERARQMDWLAARLPESGWPAGIFGRRDRLAFLLSELGALPAATLVRLPATAVTVTGPGALQVEQDGRVMAVLAVPGGGPAACPACAALRWAWVLGRAATFDRRRIEAALSRPPAGPAHACEQPGGGEGEWPDQWPLFPPCDRWGAFPAPPAPPMSLRAMEGALRAARAGTATYREQPPPRRRRDPEDLPPAPILAVPEPPPGTPGWHKAGVAARAADLRSLEALDALLDELDARAAAAADHARGIIDGQADRNAD